MSESELVYVVDAWRRGDGNSLEGFPTEVDSLQEFSALVEQLRQQGHRDTVVRLYIRGGKHDLTHRTEWIS